MTNHHKRPRDMSDAEYKEWCSNVRKMIWRECRRKRKRTKTETIEAILNKATLLYMENGARSSAKVDYLHSRLAFIIDSVLPPSFVVRLEYSVKSANASMSKKCDIVVTDTHGDPVIVFPVKFIMTSYMKNKNNSAENLTGECVHLKRANPSLRIIPINFIFASVPCLKDGVIKSFESVDYDTTFKVYENEVKHNSHKSCFQVFTCILDVVHANKAGENYDTVPTITAIQTVHSNHQTRHRVSLADYDLANSISEIVQAALPSASPSPPANPQDPSPSTDNSPPPTTTHLGL